MTGEPRAADDDVLDNVVWHSLVGPHAGFAVGDGLARAYRSDVSVFHATADDSPAAWEALVEVATPEGIVVLLRAGPITAPAGWHEVMRGEGHQMVLTAPLAAVSPLPQVDASTGADVTMRSLGDDDAPDMIDLVAQTEPGPYRPRTHELGGYVGVFHDDRLMAMAGTRMHPPGYVEVSAVCTHADARRRGYASIVSAHVAAAILVAGETPFLHVMTANASAIAVYERLGFTSRRIAPFGVYRVPPP